MISDKEHVSRQLLFVIRLGDLAQVTLLLDAGADASARDDDGNTALMWAVCRSHFETVKKLLVHGADVDARDKSGNTALMRAGKLYRLDSLELLLHYGADLFARNFENRDVSDLALENGHRELSRSLKARMVIEMTDRAKQGLLPEE